MIVLININILIFSQNIILIMRKGVISSANLLDALPALVSFVDLSLFLLDLFGLPLEGGNEPTEPAVQVRGPRERQLLQLPGIGGLSILLRQLVGVLISITTFLFLGGLSFVFGLH